MQLTAPHDEQAEKDGNIRETVDQEAPGDSDAGDKRGGEQRPGDPGQIDFYGVQRDGVRQPLRADHFHDESLPGRAVEHLHEAQTYRQDEHHPNLYGMGEYQHRHDECQQHGRRLGEVQDPPFRKAVGDDAAVCTEQQDRQELGGGQ